MLQSGGRSVGQLLDRESKRRGRGGRKEGRKSIADDMWIISGDMQPPTGMKNGPRRWTRDIGIVSGTGDPGGGGAGNGGGAFLHGGLAATRLKPLPYEQGQDLG